LVRYADDFVVLAKQMGTETSHEPLLKPSEVYEQRPRHFSASYAKKKPPPSCHDSGSFDENAHGPLEL
jgi:hypothetical protein